MTKIDSKLNIVLPTDAGLVHSTPISREIFEKYFDVIAAAYSEITGGKFSNAAGSKIAHLMLKKVAEEQNIWDGPAGVSNGLINEIIRLSNMLIETENGWQTLPLSPHFCNGKAG